MRRATIAVSRRVSTSAIRPSSLRALSSKPPGQQQQQQQQKSQEEWIHSEERAAQLSSSERWIMGIAVVSCTAAIAMFTSTKWEVERRIREQLTEEEQQKWYDGTYVTSKLAAEAAREAECEGFDASDEFAGSRPGMVFKTGPAGLGYYVDRPAS